MISRKRGIITGAIAGMAAGYVTRKIVNSTVKYRKKKAEAAAQERPVQRMAIESLGASCNIEYCDASKDEEYEYFDEGQLTQEEIESGNFEKCECVEFESE